MRNAIKKDIALLGFKTFANGIFAIGRFGAIKTAARQQRGEFCDGDAEKLVFINVIDALILVGDFVFQSHHQPLCHFAEKDAALADRIKKAGVFIAPQFRWQQIQNLIHQMRRREHFVIAEISKTTQYVGIITGLHRPPPISKNVSTETPPPVQE